MSYLNNVAFRTMLSVYITFRRLISVSGDKIQNIIKCSMFYDFKPCTQHAVAKIIRHIKEFIM